MKLLLLLGALFSSLMVHAQSSLVSPPMKWGEASEEEWKLQTVSFDTSASAVILFELATLRFEEGRSILDVYRRIKILDPKGIDEANIHLPYYHYNNMESVFGVKAQTLNQKDGKTVRTKVNNKDFFNIKRSDRWTEMRFSFPQVELGSIIEYRYTFSSNNLSTPDPWYFQHQLPTYCSHFKFKPAGSLSYVVLTYGQRIQKKYAPEQARNEWILTELPGYKDENFVYKPTDFAESVRFQLYSYRMYGGQVQNVLQSWDDIASELKEEYTPFLNQSKPARELGRKVFGNTTVDRIKSLRYLMHQEVSWNGRYSPTYQNRPKELLETKSGNSAELTLFMHQLLQSAGISSQLVLLSTRSHGRVTRNYPLINQFNHVILLADVDGDSLFIDPIYPNYPIDLLPGDDYNFWGLKLNNKTTTWVHLPSPPPNQELAFIEATLSKTGKLKGNIRLKQNGLKSFEEKAIQVRNKKGTLIPDDLSFSGIPLILDTEKIEEKGAELSATRTFSMEEPLEEKYLYFNPDVLQFFNKNPFPIRERSFPIELKAPINQRFVFVLHYPDNYEVLEIPEKKLLKLPQDLGTLNINAGYQDGTIQVSVSLVLTENNFSKLAYPHLIELFEEAVAGASTPVVLRKIE